MFFSLAYVDLTSPVHNYVISIQYRHHFGPQGPSLLSRYALCEHCRCYISNEITSSITNVRDFRNDFRKTEYLTNTRLLLNFLIGYSYGFCWDDAKNLARQFYYVSHHYLLLLLSFRSIFILMLSMLWVLKISRDITDRTPLSRSLNKIHCRILWQYNKQVVEPKQQNPLEKPSPASSKSDTEISTIRYIILFSRLVLSDCTLFSNHPVTI